MTNLKSTKQSNCFVESLVGNYMIHLFIEFLSNPIVMYYTVFSVYIKRQTKVQNV